MTLLMPVHGEIIFEASHGRLWNINDYGDMVCLISSQNEAGSSWERRGTLHVRLFLGCKSESKNLVTVPCVDKADGEVWRAEDIQNCLEGRKFYSLSIN
jgi:hypothetical protein